MKITENTVIVQPEVVIPAVTETKFVLELSPEELCMVYGALWRAVPKDVAQTISQRGLGELGVSAESKLCGLFNIIDGFVVNNKNKLKVGWPSESTRGIRLRMNDNYDVYALREKDGFVTYFIDAGSDRIEVTEPHAVWTEETSSMYMTRERARQEWRKMVSTGAVRVS